MQVLRNAKSVFPKVHDSAKLTMEKKFAVLGAITEVFSNATELSGHMTKVIRDTLLKSLNEDFSVALGVGRLYGYFDPKCSAGIIVTVDAVTITICKK